jgi:molecular chaperone Hsp33
MNRTPPFDKTAANDVGDYVLPFQFDNIPVRGRLVTLEHTVSRTLEYHPYPPPVARTLGELLAVTAGLSSLLQFDGEFSVQISGKGAVPLMICEATREGGLRAYAQVKPDTTMLGHYLSELVGTGGYLAFTAQQQGERYQGIVDLAAETLAACIERYFQQSEQIHSYVRLSCFPLGAFGWRSNALILQQMPVSMAEETAVSDEEKGKEEWERLGLLLKTLDATELLETGNQGALLLQRLFYEDTIRLFPTRPLHPWCRCSPDRLKKALNVLLTTDLQELVAEGQATMTCEFCNKSYTVSRETLEELLRERDEPTAP